VEADARGLIGRRSIPRADFDPVAQLFEGLFNQSRHGRRVNHFDSQAYHGGVCCPGLRENTMKVAVVADQHGLPADRFGQYRFIG